MPRSKRAKVVHMSKVTKKGKVLSEHLFSSVREAASNYQYCFVFSVDNMRNTYLKEVRTDLKDSRLFFGKTKVMAKALGLTPEEEHLPNLWKLSTYLNGNVGLVFTNQNPSAIKEYFDFYVRTDYARAGTEASRDFEIPEGIVYSRGGEIPIGDDVPMAHSLEPTLRNWGMPTRLIKGKITLGAPYTVCTKRQTLNGHQTALLKIFGVATADFRVQVLGYYDSMLEKVFKAEPLRTSLVESDDYVFVEDS